MSKILVQEIYDENIKFNYAFDNICNKWETVFLSENIKQLTFKLQKIYISEDCKFVGENHKHLENINQNCNIDYTLDNPQLCLKKCDDELSILLRRYMRNKFFYDVKIYKRLENIKQELNNCEKMKNVVNLCYVNINQLFQNVLDDIKNKRDQHLRDEKKKQIQKRYRKL
jgi:hypothetical protein